MRLPVYRMFLLLGLIQFSGRLVFAQKIDNIINVKETERIERILSSDEMQGRAAFTPAIDKAADFIKNEFKVIGLETPDNSGSYLQDFTLVKTKFISAKAKFDGDSIAMNNIVAFTSNPDLIINQDSVYKTR